MDVKCQGGEKSWETYLEIGIRKEITKVSFEAIIFDIKSKMKN